MSEKLAASVQREGERRRNLRDMRVRYACKRFLRAYLTLATRFSRVSASCARMHALRCTRHRPRVRPSLPPLPLPQRTPTAPAPRPPPSPPPSLPGEYRERGRDGPDPGRAAVHAGEELLDRRPQAVRLPPRAPYLFIIGAPLNIGAPRLYACPRKQEEHPHHAWGRICGRASGSAARLPPS